MGRKMSANTKSTDKSPYVWAMLRIGLGFTFFWAFLDKMFGLGFATCRDAATSVINSGCADAWTQGGSPTTGFLKFATKGPFADFYQGLAGSSTVDLLFMAGLFGVGLGLILGIGVKLSSITGMLILALMWSATLWPANNPILDEHIIYIFVLAGLYHNNSSQKWGLRSWWIKRPIVKNLPILE